MNATIDRNSEKTLLDLPPQAGTEDFNFDLWARAVKRQMIAALKKREYKE